QHEHPEAARKTILQHAGELGIHERLAAGEADFFGPPSLVFDLVEVGGDLGALKINEPIVLRGGLDVAVAAGDVAERAGVEPQRLEFAQRDAGAPLPARSNGWI